MLNSFWNWFVILISVLTILARMVRTLMRITNQFQNEFSMDYSLVPPVMCGTTISRN
jgi:hypothetical protein